MVAVGIMKIIATAVSIGVTFGGSIFSPALVIGAMVGGGYGLVAGHFLPGVISEPGAAEAMSVTP